MTDLLVRYSNWKVILCAFLLLLVFSVVAFPTYQARMAEAAGEQVEPLDMRSSYTIDEVVRDFEKLGAEGRAVYRIVVGRIDMIFPLLYGSFFILLLASLLKKVLPYRSTLILLSFFPLIGMLFDYLENIHILKLLDTFPTLNTETVALAERFTLLKHAFLLASVAMVVLLVLFLVFKRIYSRVNLVRQ